MGWHISYVIKWYAYIYYGVYYNIYIIYIEKKFANILSRQWFDIFVCLSSCAQVPLKVLCIFHFFPTHQLRLINSCGQKHTTYMQYTLFATQAMTLDGATGCSEHFFLIPSIFRGGSERRRIGWTHLAKCLRLFDLINVSICIFTFVRMKSMIGLISLLGKRSSNRGNWVCRSLRRCATLADEILVFASSSLRALNESMLLVNLTIQIHHIQKISIIVSILLSQFPDPRPFPSLNILMTIDINSTAGAHHRVWWQVFPLLVSPHRYPLGQHLLSNFASSSGNSSALHFNVTGFGVSNLLLCQFLVRLLKCSLRFMFRLYHIYRDFSASPLL